MVNSQHAPRTSPIRDRYPDSKFHGANLGPTWVLSAPDGPHVGPMNLAIWECVSRVSSKSELCFTAILLLLQCCIQFYIRADSRFALSKWETVLLCNDVYHILFWWQFIVYHGENTYDYLINTTRFSLRIFALTAVRVVRSLGEISIQFFNL